LRCRNYLGPSTRTTGDIGIIPLWIAAVIPIIRLLRLDVDCSLIIRIWIVRKRSAIVWIGIGIIRIPIGIYIGVARCIIAKGVWVERESQAPTEIVS
jgi:hypothetical protein